MPGHDGNISLVHNVAFHSLPSGGDGMNVMWDDDAAAHHS